MTVRELANQLERLSAQTKRQFARIDERFAKVDERFERIDERFERLQRDLEDRIREEGETTRRHFDIVADQFRAETRLSLDKSMATADQVAALRTINEHEHAGFAGAIDDHEARLRALEK